VRVGGVKEGKAGGLRPGDVLRVEDLRSPFLEETRGQ